jgi:methylmalonyl-CoA mutase C-terminal domain/subunit
MVSTRAIRVLVAKPGLDGHDKGAKIVSRGLRDAGMEVIYTGIRQSVDAILETAVEEAVDVIGLSILSGSHLSICRELTEKMEQRDMKDTQVLVGGIIPKKDVALLKEMGIAEVFRPGSTINEIVQFHQKAV